MPSTNSIELNVRIGSIKKEKLQQEKPGSTKMLCNENLTQDPFSLSVKAIPLSFLLLFQT